MPGLRAASYSSSADSANVEVVSTAAVSVYDDARTGLNPADALQEQLACAERAREGERLVGRQRDQQAARRLRVVAERKQLLREAVGLDVRSGEVAIARVAARPDAAPRDLECAVERRQRRGVEADPDAAAVGRLVHMPEEAKAGDVGDGARLERPHDVGGGGVQRRHPPD